MHAFNSLNLTLAIWHFVFLVLETEFLKQGYICFLLRLISVDVYTCPTFKIIYHLDNLLFSSA